MTRTKLGGLFEYDDLGNVELKGFERPVRVINFRRATSALADDRELEAAE